MLFFLEKKKTSWWGKESWLLCLICLPGVSWWLSGSSSRCHHESFLRFVIVVFPDHTHLLFFHLHKIIQNRGLLSVCLHVCLYVLLMNKTSTNSLIFYFDKAKQKMCVQVTWKNIPKYCVLLSTGRNNPVMLKGLKSVHLKTIQMYHFWLKW